MALPACSRLVLIPYTALWAFRFAVAVSRFALHHVHGSGSHAHAINNLLVQGLCGIGMGSTVLIQPQQRQSEQQQPEQQQPEQLSTQIHESHRIASHRIQ
jgi:hypothetical protein